MSSALQTAHYLCFGDRAFSSVGEPANCLFCRTFEQELAAAEAASAPHAPIVALVKAMTSWQTSFIQRQEAWLASVKHAVSAPSADAIGAYIQAYNARSAPAPAQARDGAANAGAAAPAARLLQPNGGGPGLPPGWPWSHPGSGKQLDLWKGGAMRGAGPDDDGQIGVARESQGVASLSQLGDVGALASQEGVTTETLAFLKQLDNSQSQPWPLSQLAMVGQSQENLPPMAPARAPRTSAGTASGSVEAAASAEGVAEREHARSEPPQ